MDKIINDIIDQDKLRELTAQIDDALKKMKTDKLRKNAMKIVDDVLLDDLEKTKKRLDL